jgi:hypothetical protein
VSVRNVIIGSALALTVTMASAEQGLLVSANSVIPGCKVLIEGRNSGRQDVGYCVGALSALVFMSSGPALPAWACLNVPTTATVEQGARVVIRYIDARPQRMHENFNGLALEALRDAWPCRK